MSDLSTSHTEFHVHLADGAILRYEFAGEAEARRVVERIQLDQIFDDRQFMVAGDYSLTGYNAWRVERLDLDTDIAPRWPIPQGWREIQAEEFEERCAHDGARLRRGEIDPDRPKSLSQVHFAVFECVSGKRAYVEIRMREQHPIEQRSVAEHILIKPAIVFQREERGVALLNPRNVARWTLYPGPAKAPLDAWKAHRREAGLLSSQAFETEAAGGTSAEYEAPSADDGEDLA